MTHQPSELSKVAVHSRAALFVSQTSGTQFPSQGARGMMLRDDTEGVGSGTLADPQLEIFYSLRFTAVLRFFCVFACLFVRTASVQMKLSFQRNLACERAPGRRGRSRVFGFGAAGH